MFETRSPFERLRELLSDVEPAMSPIDLAVGNPRHAPPPFVADDILETFDDDRAAETFQALAEMSGRGQIIYLTHHAHLIDIVRRVAPAATVHRLPDPLSAAAQTP